VTLIRSAIILKFIMSIIFSRYRNLIWMNFHKATWNALMKLWKPIVLKLSMSFITSPASKRIKQRARMTLWKLPQSLKILEEMKKLYNFFVSMPKTRKLFLL